MGQTKAFKLLMALVVSPLIMFYDPYSALIQAIGILVIMDIATGIFAAKKEGQDIKSRAFLRKIPQVVLFLFGLAAAKEASPLLVEFGIAEHQIGKWFCALYGAYELFSVLENLGRLGLPVAKQMSDLLRSKLPDDVKQAIDEVPKV